MIRQLYSRSRVSACLSIICVGSLTSHLSASTALEFVQALRIATDVSRISTLVSIYQAGESLYELFDKVCVIYEGKMAYFGPANRARQYFIDMGFEPANRQTTADFLVAGTNHVPRPVSLTNGCLIVVTDPNGRIVRSGFEDRAPRTAIEFTEFFKASDLAQLNHEDIESYKMDFVGKEHRLSTYRESAAADRAKHTRPGSSFITSVPMQARALMVRRAQILMGGYAAQVIHLSYV